MKSIRETQKRNLGYGLHSKELSLYVHIPFCDLICPYCDFNKYSNVDNLIEDFIKSLITEIEIKSKKFKTYQIKSIFFGGGTPSYLKETRLSKIVEKIKSLYNVNSNAEISIEINPRDINKNILNTYSALGINRISIGGQSFDDKVLKKLGRNHGANDLIKSINLIKESAFSNINLDLIFGVPDQTLNQWKDTLNKFVQFNIPHISTYCLTFEPKTKYFKDLEKNKISEPKETLIIKMFNYTSKFLSDNGYNQYEISNWSKDNFECHHNLRYWKMEDYLGFGPGSSSFIRGERSKNIRSLKDYIKKSKEEKISDKTYIQNNYTNSNKDNMFEYIMLNLRLKTGINHDDFKFKFNNNFSSMNKNLIADLTKIDLIKHDKSHTYLTKKGIMLSDEISRKFIQDLV